MTTPARVLVVDDQPINRSIVSMILGPEGYDIVEAGSGEEALQIIGSQVIDLVLLDVVLPGIDGIEVCRQLREDMKLAMLPVVVISSLSDVESRTRGKQVGADDFLSKPLHPAELVARCRNLLRLRQAYAESVAMRERAELAARKWRIASDVGAALAGYFDYSMMVRGLLRLLRAELSIEAIAFYTCTPDLELSAIAPARYEARARAASLPASFDGTAPPDPAGFAPLGPVLELSEVVPFSLIGPDGPLGVLVAARNRPLSATEREVCEAILPHVANAVVAIRSHLATVETLLAQERAQAVARAALQISEQRERLLFDGSPLPIWIHDPATARFVAVNPAFASTCGYTREELDGMSVGEVDLGAGDGEPRDHRLRCRDGKLALLDVRSHAMRIDDRQVIVTIGLDVTRTRLVEEHLRQADKMEAIGALAGGVAHDFNNLLAVILSNAELALEAIGPTNPIAVELGEIEATARRGTALTRQLLAFSRKQPQAVEVVDVNDAVGGMIKLLGRLVGKQVELATRLDPYAGYIRIDPSQLQQIVMNLVVNARDAMAGKGKVSIETEQMFVDTSSATAMGVTAGEFTVLSVRDTGCGMSREVLDRIFEPFFTTKPVGKGTGIGLSTVFAITRQNLGAVLVESEPGVGSTFRVYLPCAAPDAVRRERRSTRQIVDFEGGSEVVLVVDDDAPLRSVVVKQLAAIGYHVLEASDGQAALDQLRAAPTRVDLVLTDVVMPGIDGRELATRIEAEYPSTKLLFMSGYTDHPSVQATPLPPERLIPKPFTRQQLSTALRQVLGASAN